MAKPDPVSSARVFVNGAEIEMHKLLELKVRDNLLLPDTASIRFQDPDGKYVDNPSFAVGSELEVRFGALGDVTEEPLFKGEIVALEPEFTQKGRVVGARAYDRAHKLHAQRRSQTFQNQKAEDIVRAVGAGAGLRPGTIDPTSTLHEFFQQSMETDWEFCWRLARMNDFEFVVQDMTFHFRKRRREAVAATLTYGENLIAFAPRMSAAGQVKEVTVANHDPKSRQPLTATATTPALNGESPAVKERNQLVARVGGGSVVVADRVVTSAAEAQKLAQVTLDRVASRFVEGEGKAFGDPKLRAGVTVKIDGTGSFSGEYVLSQTTHAFTGDERYVTSFVISGSTGHTFAELLGGGNGAGSPDWSSSLVIGMVTNNNDPAGLGRVRVKFPALGDQMEGWWARVATLNAGAERGVFMLPEVGDEVVVGFEHGDSRRPFVLGSLYTGKEKPPKDLVAPDRKARFGVKSDENVHIEAEKEMRLRSKEKMFVEVTGGPGDFSLDAKGNVEQKAAKGFKQTAGQTVEIQANQSVTVKGTGSVTVESTGSLTLKGATIDIQASGPVNVKGAMINLG